MNRTLRVATVAGTALLALSGLAACSSSDQPGTSPSDSSSSAAPPPSESPSESSSAAESPSSKASASPKQSSSPESVTIMIKDFKYSGPSSVAPGTKITVKNEDTAAHTVTSRDDGKFDVKVDGGKSVTFTAPSASGSYDFYCIYHSNMSGTLKVS